MDPSHWNKNPQSSFNVLLSRECINGIGEDLLQKAFNIFDTHEEDFVEVSYVIMSCVMFGENKFRDEKGNAACGYRQEEPMATAIVG